MASGMAVSNVMLSNCARGLKVSVFLLLAAASGLKVMVMYLPSWSPLGCRGAMPPGGAGCWGQCKRGVGRVDDARTTNKLGVSGPTANRKDYHRPGHALLSPVSPAATAFRASSGAFPP